VFAFAPFPFASHHTCNIEDSFGRNARLTAASSVRAPAAQHDHAVAPVRPDDDAGKTAGVQTASKIERRQDAGFETAQCLDCDDLSGMGGVRPALAKQMKRL
jgi:hypothetical protein